MEEKHAPCVVCLGFFDGVHLAHQALLRAARAEGERLHLPVCVHTFDRAPGEKDFALTSLSEREALLKAAGAGRVAVSAFNEEMRRKGVQLVSGQSASVFRQVMQCVGMNPVEAMEKVINSDRYAAIAVA